MQSKLTSPNSKFSNPLLMKRTHSLPVSVTNFFKLLEDTERGMAYAILIEYLETGKLPERELPSAVRCAIQYAIEKLQHRKIPQANSVSSGQNLKAIPAAETHTSQSTDNVKSSGHSTSEKLNATINTLVNAAQADPDDVEKMEKVVKLAYKTCSTKAKIDSKIRSELERRFPGKYSDIIYDKTGLALLIPKKDH